MKFIVYSAAALCEIAGCYAFWAWWRLDRSVIWLIPGALSLFAFAWLLSLVDTGAAGRTFAGYGGLYIAASLAWLWAVEGLPPDRWDTIGAAICLGGAAVIVFGPRAA